MQCIFKQQLGIYCSSDPVKSFVNIFLMAMSLKYRRWLCKLRVIFRRLAIFPRNKSFFLNLVYHVQITNLHTDEASNYLPHKSFHRWVPVDALTDKQHHSLSGHAFRDNTSSSTNCHQNIGSNIPIICMSSVSSHIDPVPHSIALRSAGDVTINCWWRHNNRTIVTRSRE